MRNVTFHISWLLTASCLLIGCAKNPYGLLDAPSSQEVEVTSAYPAVVEVILPGGYGLCTGTFITPRTVISAAHCLTEAGTYSVATSFGMFTTHTKTALGPGVVNDPNDFGVLIFDRDVADPAQGQVVAIGELPLVGDHIRLVGFGCNNLDARTGAGVKRTGTNRVIAIDDYLELATTPTATLIQSHDAQGILGPDNQAGSCFGDSGGPMFETQGNMLKLVGATHAGGWSSNMILSEYINLNRTENLAFLHTVDRNNDLHLFDGCWNSEDPEACGPSSASFQIISFFKHLWWSLLNLFF